MEIARNRRCTGICSSALGLHRPMNTHPHKPWQIATLLALLVVGGAYLAQRFLARQPLSALNGVPIVFYGQIEDQFGKPVGDADVKFGVRVYNGWRSTVDRGSVRADAGGRFKITGYNGESISVLPEKTGYIVRTQIGSGIYSHMWSEEQRAHPDPARPVIIKMWKAQGAEPLLQIDKRLGSVRSDSPAGIDLIEGRFVGGGEGDLDVQAECSDVSVGAGQAKAWSVRVEATGGGLIEAEQSEYPIAFRAPDVGYESSKTFKHDPSEQGITKYIFIKSRSGQVFTKLQIMFFIYDDAQDQLHIEMRGFANTNASQNWEPPAR